MDHGRGALREGKTDKEEERRQPIPRRDRPDTGVVDATSRITPISPRWVRLQQYRSTAVQQFKDVRCWL